MSFIRLARYRILKLASSSLVALSLALLLLCGDEARLRADDAKNGAIEVGLAVRDVTPAGPVWLAGYEARKRPSDRVDHPLLAQAIALRGASGHRLVLVALDNCEVSREFIINRRMFSGGRVVFGEEPDGPVDWDVPVLLVKSAAGATRAIVFGYACHATTITGKPLFGDDWYSVSADYVGYARDRLKP